MRLNFAIMLGIIGLVLAVIVVSQNSDAAMTQCLKQHSLKTCVNTLR